MSQIGYYEVNRKHLATIKEFAVSPNGTAVIVTMKGERIHVESPEDAESKISALEQRE